jgi:hypothetical protein
VENCCNLTKRKKNKNKNKKQNKTKQNKKKTQNKTKLNKTNTPPDEPSLNPIKNAKPDRTKEQD